jgi:hypothetical protein
MFAGALGKVKRNGAPPGATARRARRALLLRARAGRRAAGGDEPRDYYAFLGDTPKQIVQSAATDEETVNAYLAAFEEAGADEAICFPTSPDPDQVELLARAAGLSRDAGPAAA